MLTKDMFDSDRRIHCGEGTRKKTFREENTEQHFTLFVLLILNYFFNALIIILLIF